MVPSDTTVLLERARAGSREALDEVFARYGPKLLAWIRLRLGRGLRSRVDSRDVLNESLLRAFTRLDQLRGDDGRSLMAWLARIADNEIRDLADFHGRERRDAGRAIPLDPALATVAADLRSQTSRIALAEEALRLEQALERLEPDWREVIVLRKLEELSFTEIAERMGRSPDACRMLLARAMTALTLELAEVR